MARSRIRVKMNRQGIRDLMTSDGAREMVESRANAIAEACNAESSWGGYHASASNGLDGKTKDSKGRLRGAGGRFVSGGVRARARVWSADNRNDEARDQRLVRNMDAL